MFLHQGNIVKVDQLSYYSSDLDSTDSIQHVGKTTIPYEDVGVGLIKDSALMGTFSILSHNTTNINMITSSTIPFADPWIVPLESELDSFNDMMPLSPFEIAYQAI